MAETTTTTTTTTPTTKAPTVRHLRQALLWPVRLMPLADDQPARHRPWQVLRDMGEASPWREVIDEYTGDREDFHERHYNEFVSFLPYVQRFLYGEGRGKGRQDHVAESPMRVFRRRDIAALRVVPKLGDAPITLQVVHIDLYFFFDVDVVLLNVEVSASDLSLAQAQEQLYRFGRAYPAGWSADGAALHCMNLLAEVESPLWKKLTFFGVIAVLTTWLTFYTLIKSRRLSDFIDALSDDKQTWRGRLGVLARVWRPGSD